MPKTKRSSENSDLRAGLINYKSGCDNNFNTITFVMLLTDRKRPHSRDTCAHGRPRFHTVYKNRVQTASK